MRKMFLRIGSVSAFLAVALGAFGSHFLKWYLSPEQLSSFDAGVRYQMIHSLAILLVATLIHFGKKRNLIYSGWLFTAGIVLFSGSIYVIALQDVLVLYFSYLWLATPLGGICFLTGWAFLFSSTFQKSQDYHHSSKSPE